MENSKKPFSKSNSISMPDLSSKELLHNKQKRRSESNVLKKWVRKTKNLNKRRLSLDVENIQVTRTEKEYISEPNNNDVETISADEAYDETLATLSRQTTRIEEHDETQSVDSTDDTKEDTDEQTSDVVSTFSNGRSTMSSVGSLDVGNETVLNSRSARKLNKYFNLNETVLTYYVCAYATDILYQGSLYITQNNFAFYSSIFGIVNKVLIPVKDVTSIEKRRTASFIPNAVGVYTVDGKCYIFSSLISRDNTFKFMNHVWKKANLTTSKNPEIECSDSDSDSTSLEHDDKVLDSSSQKRTSDTSLQATKTLSNPPKKRLRNVRTSNEVSSPLNMDEEKAVIWTLAFIAVGLFSSAAYLLFRVETLSRQNNSEVPTLENLQHEIFDMQRELHLLDIGKVLQDITNQLPQLESVRQSIRALYDNH